jgi:hypothetical protein
MKNHIHFMETAEKLFLAYNFVVNLPTSLTWHMKDREVLQHKCYRIHTADSKQNMTAFLEYRDKVFSVSHYL